MDTIRDADPKLDALRIIVDEWHRIIGTVRTSVGELIGIAGESNQTIRGPEFKYLAFRDALLVVSGEGDAIDGQRLGMWLGANAGRVVGQMKIVREGMLNGHRQWRLEGKSAAWRTAA